MEGGNTENLAKPKGLHHCTDLTKQLKSSNQQPILHEGVFECLSRSHQIYRVRLTPSNLLLQPITKTENVETFSLDDLFGCHTFRHKKHGPNFIGAYICFYFYPRVKRGLLSSRRVREKIPLVFQIRGPNASFQTNLDVAFLWKGTVISLIRLKFTKWQIQRLRTQEMGVKSNRMVESTQHSRKNISFSSSKVYDSCEKKPISWSKDSLDSESLESLESINFELLISLSSQRLFSRRFLVILNPKSGQGKTMSLYKEQVQPIFMESGIKASLFITDSAGHARSMISTADLSNVDGIVTVGGDGLLYEVVNGLRSRSDSHECSEIPVGIIAGGSGNGLARSIAEYSGEAEDYLQNPVIGTALAVARGKVSHVNLAEIDLDGRKVYSFLSVGWGILADIDIESEVLRKLGECRFTLWSLLRIANLRTYNAQLSFRIEEVESSMNPISLGRGSNPIDSQALHTIDGDFVSVYAVWQSHIGSDMVYAPSALANDGWIHLTFIKSDVSRARVTQFLLGLDKGAHVNMPGVTYAKVKEFSIRSKGGICGTVTIDGERVTGEHLKVKLSPKPLIVFSF